MIDKWMQNGRAKLYEIKTIEKGRGDLELDEEDVNLLDDNFEKVFDNIQSNSKEYQENYLDLDNQRIDSRPVLASMFTRKFFRQMSPNMDRDYKRYEELDEKNQDFYDSLSEEQKQSIEKTTGEKIRVKNQSLGEYLFEKANSSADKKTKKCSICKESPAGEIKRWVFPFMITRKKFPNLYPSLGESKSCLCERCIKISLSAYGNVIYNYNNDRINIILFFADDYKKLFEFYSTIQRSPSEWYYSNFELEGPSMYPFETFANLLYKIVSRRGEELNPEKLKLGAILLGIDVSGSKNIYQNFEEITDLKNHFEFFLQISKEEGKGKNIFVPFMIDLANSKGEEEGYLRRNKILENLLKYQEIDGRRIQEALFYNIKEYSRGIRYIHYIIKTFYEVNDMNEKKQIFENVYKLGYRIGKRVEETHNSKRVKNSLYSLRRARKPADFLINLNNIQIDTESNINPGVFNENRDSFKELKAFFLIGMTNAMAGGKNND